MVHIKHFDDAYSQSREHFFLDLLKQQGAPVPQVIKNDIQNKAIHMTHVGIDLRQWLLGLHANKKDQSRAMHVLHESLVCCQKISQLGVWHLDLASRNVMVSESSERSAPVIHIIDFSLATSPQFPLQKPLWIRPNADQHHLTLQRAVIQDWDAFFQQAQIAPPPRYDLDFEIPVEDYAKTWLSQLAVDQLSHPWCVIAHSVGNLLVEASTASCFEASVAHRLQQLGHSGKNLSEEADAKNLFAQIMSFLATPASNETPRPRARPQPAQESNSQALSPEPPIQATTLDSPTETQPPIQTPPAPTQASQFWPWVFLICCTGAGYALADVLFWSYKLRLSSFVAVVVICVFILSALLLVGSIFKSQPYPWRFRAVQWHSFGLLFLGLDLWLSNTSQHWFYAFITLSVFVAWKAEKYLENH